MKKNTVFKFSLKRFEKLAVINHQLSIRIKFRDHSCLFHQSLKKLAIVERLFCRCREVAVVQSFKKGQCVDCPRKQKRWPLVEFRL